YTRDPATACTSCPGHGCVTTVNVDVAPELLEVMGLRLREGRWLDRRGCAAPVEEAVVTSELAAELRGWGCPPTVGSLVDRAERTFTVVGVGESVRLAVPWRRAPAIMFT